MSLRDTWADFEREVLSLDVENAALWTALGEHSNVKFPGVEDFVGRVAEFVTGDVEDEIADEPECVDDPAHSLNLRAVAAIPAAQIRIIVFRALTAARGLVEDLGYYAEGLPDDYDLTGGDEDAAKISRAANA